jgi:PASTA domain
MSFDTTNLVFSLLLLRQRRVSREKALAASVGASLIPGPIGLVLPLILTRGRQGGGGGGGGGISGVIDRGDVLVKVPDVVGEKETDAVQAVQHADLSPVTSTFFSDDDKVVGTVVDQDPAANKFAQVGSEVNLVVAQKLAPTEGDKDDAIIAAVKDVSSKEDQILAALEKSGPMSTKGRPSGGQGSGNP